MSMIRDLIRAAISTPIVIDAVGVNVSQVALLIEHLNALPKYLTTVEIPDIRHGVLVASDTAIKLAKPEMAANANKQIVWDDIRSISDIQWELNPAVQRVFGPETKLEYAINDGDTGVVDWANTIGVDAKLHEYLIPALMDQYVSAYLSLGSTLSCRPERCVQKSEMINVLQRLIDDSQVELWISADQFTLAYQNAK
jgi:hypothetical protein